MKPDHGVWTTYPRHVPPPGTWTTEGPFCTTCNRPVYKMANGRWRHKPVRKEKV
jgi:hypothetical protein